MNRATLRKIISEQFNLDELQTLCFDLTLDFEEIGGNSKQAKVVELIAYFERNGQTHRLLEAIQKVRPELNIENQRKLRSTFSPESENLIHHSHEIDIDVGHLPTPNVGKIFGREGELKQLIKHLKSPSISVASIVGFAGIGKSTLIDLFLTSIAPRYEKATKVLGWHFYSQETKDSAVSSSSLFFDYALRFFDFEEHIPNQDIEKARILAKLVRDQNSIVILDGVEALQHLPTIHHGQFHDFPMQAFITDIARNGLPMGGLIIITSRQQLVEMNRFESAKAIELSNINLEDGIKLLQYLGISGTSQELAATVKDYRGHALSLMLLGNLLVNDYGGDVWHRAKVDALDYEMFKSSTTILEYYNRDWEDHGHERVFLYLVSLLNRPIHSEELFVLKKKAKIAHSLPELQTVQFNRLVSKLISLGLIVKFNQSYDTHSLIRSHFLQEFKNKHPEEYEDAHKQLFDYFVSIPEKKYPETLEEIEPLYRAIYHGCQSRLYVEAMELYWIRISRQREFYSQKKLGAISTDLYAIMNFFPDGWRPFAEEDLSLDKQAWLLAVASFLLMSLGRLEDALIPRYAEIEIFESLQDWSMAAGDSRNLVQILLALGRLDEAQSVAKKSIEYANRATHNKSKTQFSKNADLILTLVTCKSRLAYVNYLIGNIEGAQKEFEEAEQLQGSQLERTSGFYYLRLLLRVAKPEAMDELELRAEKGLERSKFQNDIKNIANYTLIKARIHQYKKQYDQALLEFNVAIQDLRRSQRLDNLPHALLKRADFYKQRWLETSNNNWRDLCQEDLLEVENHVNSFRMVLFDIDRRIIQASIWAHDRKTSLAQDLYIETKRMIFTSNYRLKIQELEDSFLN